MRILLVNQWVNPSVITCNTPLLHWQFFHFRVCGNQLGMSDFKNLIYDVLLPTARLSQKEKRSGWYQQVKTMNHPQHPEAVI